MLPNCDLTYPQFPFQQNDNDCGVYVVKYAQHLLSGETVNHSHLALADCLSSNWKSLDHSRLRLWMDLPKRSSDWMIVPSCIRNLSSYSKYLDV